MTVIYAGLATGAVYALIAVGYNLIQLAANVLNFANAHLFVLAGFIGYWGITVQSLPPALVLVISAGACGLVALAEERTAIRPLAGSTGHTELITTVGFGTVITGVILLAWGADPKEVDFLGSGHAFSLGGGRLAAVDIVLVVLAVVVALGLHIGASKTRVGLATLALAEDAEAAQLRGIDTRLFAIVGFCVTGAVAGLLGPVIAVKTFAVVSLPLIMAVKGFVAMTLGGAGSFVGALAGGLVLGLIESVCARYLDPGAKDVVIFALFMAVLLTRPQGMFGRRELRSV
ncbi:branched-chain amino acid ABC transporter permease [Dactylosporangium sp. AC04546]|uniref:branched-chain amino acid ABC transporter permease n=1 Tax=Dactylosporangium sp. AC04546 TaxID=2862460 RepID=UPI001EE08794|nr:branched-chain amino acid ABC transporter permease [Dactylosporangium sp. AC04546]WVK86832.1 branched-chain amino acid ABC transporter permease [Dactylosporangium sp. AC04546]